MDVVNPATDVTSRYRHSSLWMDQLAGVDPICARPRLDGDRTVDVVVVGAGYTGLWTAYHLATSDVDLEILVIDAEIAGAGASSRNGGWCSGEVPAPMSRFPPSEMRDLYRAVWAGIDEIGAIVAREGIECHYTKGGSVTVATSEPQAMRLRAELAAFGALGFGAEDHRWLTSAETVGVFGAAGVHGSVFTPHCAVVQPAGLVRGLASAVERAGETICDGTPALRVEPARDETPWGAIRARSVENLL